ncbi:SCO1664 family protein [Hamadaea sp. NPDC050747]|uniref:SCO1664 family protein n=1 Tax=Hamadaea sp. NPDC050747 TaxID=3155789 RepID=UPI0033F7654F
MATTADKPALALLVHGEMEIEGRLVDASNTTLRVILTHEGAEARAVYKPVRGEAPLWDFPDGTLAGREVAAYLVSEALGWNVVPPTVLRDGPLGPGMCQLWIDELDEPPVGFIPAYAVPEGWFPIASARDEEGDAFVLAHADLPALARMALFDAVVNNADRKGGHVLAAGDRLYGVDHGICFHSESKLRTVLWGFAGREIPDDLRADLLGLSLDGLLDDHLTVTEISALADRIGMLTTLGVFPQPDPDRRVLPWPPI